MKLSILIPTTTKRQNFFNSIINSVVKQIDDKKDIEVLGLLDNYTKTIGEKRNNLLNICSGKFTLFLDDDDRLTEDFLEQILLSINNNPDADCIVYDMLCIINKCRTIHSKFGIEYEYTKMDPWTTENCSIITEEPEIWYGKPSHNMVWSSKISKSCVFPSCNSGEDFAWVKQAWPKLKKQVRIDKIIYYYDVVLGKKY
jgi:glycosyltransferase involved in cell wall biosynthesis